MFTRGDKPSDPIAPGRSPSREPEPDAPVAVEPKPATAQPLTRAAPAQPGTHSVSVISRALKITGQLESTEDIQIDGIVEGDVRAASVKVGAGARIKGTVYGDMVELAGTVDGRIEAKKVVLLRSAHMSGDVVHQDIQIESGAFIDGHCKPESAKPSAAATPAATKATTAQSGNL
jgi:cytoskeletal protein CcmA (bactofilin family)